MVGLFYQPAVPPPSVEGSALELSVLALSLPEGGNCSELDGSGVDGDSELGGVVSDDEGGGSTCFGAKFAVMVISPDNVLLKVVPLMPPS